MKTTSLALAVLSLALPLGAQTGRQPAADQSLQEAVKMAGSGNLAGAIQKLEALRKQSQVTPLPVLSLLGAYYLQAKRPQEALAVLKPIADTETADPAVLYNAGRAAFALGQKDVWLGYLQRAAQKAPASPAARDLGLVYMRQGQVVEAYGFLRPWALTNPNDRDSRLAAASLAVQLERPQEAEQLVLNMSQDDPSIRLLRGRIQMQKGDGPGALTLLEPLQAKHPQGMDLEVRRSLAEAYLLANRPADAVKTLTGKAGNHPALVLLLGRAQHRAGNAQAALATLKPLADKLPPDPSTLGDPRPAAGIAVEYGSLLLEGGRAAEALPVLEKATRLYPTSRDAWQALAKAYDAAGRKAEAAKARTQAEQIALAAARPPAQPQAAAPRAPAAAPVPAPGPRQPPPAAGPALSPDMQEAISLASQNRLAEALTQVRKVLAQAPNSPPARALELRLLLRLDRADEALRITEEMLRKRPNDPDLVYQRGAIQMARKNWAAAEKDLRHALELEPRQTGAMNDLAVLLINQGRKAEAQTLLQKILQINPGDQNAATNLKAIQQGGPGKPQ
jgi:Flp pilus assembly protein TadD